MNNKTVRNTKRKNKKFVLMPDFFLPYQTRKVLQKTLTRIKRLSAKKTSTEVVYFGDIREESTLTNKKERR